MKEDDGDFIALGKLGKPYGVKGWLKLYPFTDSPDNLLNYTDWFLQKKSDTSPIAVEHIQPQGKAFIVKLAGVETPEAASLLTHGLIGIQKAALPPSAHEKGEFYWVELEGLKAIHVSGAVLGIVTGLMETGAQDVLIVRGEKEYLFPYVWKEVIQSVDLNAGEIWVDWPLDL